MEDRKNALKEEIGSLEKNALDLRLSDAISELSVYDNHPGDVASETFEREKDIAFRENARNNIMEIEDAEKRMAEGTYGRCLECGREIDSERLEAIPWTKVCVDCKLDQEKLPDSYRRPAEELVLNPPFSRTYLDNTDYTGFDGEDAWQAVARYGTATNIAFVNDDVDGDPTPEVEEDESNME
jgi:YteA family regulatory protein